MLILSPRHTPDDLALWAELEEVDRLGAGPALDALADAAVAEVGRFRATGPCYCGVSWGKDSVTVAHLCLLADPSIPLLHLRPTNHHPDSDAVRDAYFTAFPGQSYVEVLVDYGDLHARNLPPDTLDRETDRRWYAAIRQSARPWDGRRVLGIRSEESTGRRLRTLRWGLSSPSGCAPIARWRTRHVYAYLASRGLPVHPAYACLGGGRWPREWLRVAELGDTRGAGGGRREWELEYYPSEVRRLQRPH